MKDLQKQLGDLWVRIQALGKPILKHHVFIITVLVLGAMIFVIFRINQQLQQTGDEAYRVQQESESIHTTFDQTTINRIKQLCRGSESCSVDFGDSRKRFSPFIE